MAIRLLPFRQYAETDVINMFALQSSDINEAVNDTGNGDAGVFVKVTNGNLDDGPNVYDSTYTSYLGVDSSTLPWVGKNEYPRVTIEVGAASAGDQPLGVTLYQTAKTDENGQKLLYYPQKKLETQSCIPGEAVPVLSRGIIAVAASTGALPKNTANSASVLDLSPAFAGGAANQDVVGSGVELANFPANPALGQLVIAQNDEADVNSGTFGHILATGSRVVSSGQTADQFAGKPGLTDYAGGPGLKSTGYYAIIHFDAVNAAGNITVS